MKNTLTLKEATEEFINSSVFAELAKKKVEGAKYRVMRSRFNKGKLDALAMVNLLVENGYIIEVKRK